MNRVVLTFSTEREFGRAAASHVGRTARRVLAEKPYFSLALSGGKSPLPVFRHLLDESLFPAALWKKTHIFYVDERMVPVEHPDSNHGNAARALLNHVPISTTHLHPMPTNTPFEHAALAYGQTLCAYLPRAANGRPMLDLLLLGMGPDGHTASIFTPGQGRAPEQPPVLTVQPPDRAPRVARLTLGTAMLNAAREILFLVTGADKLPALNRVFQGDRALPATWITARPQAWYTYLSPPTDSN